MAVPGLLNAKLGFLLVAVAGCLLGSVSAYHAASNEVRGVAVFSKRKFPRGGESEIVTREFSPSKFRSATDELWGVGILFFAVGTAGFLMYRKLNDAV